MISKDTGTNPFLSTYLPTVDNLVDGLFRKIEESVVCEMWKGNGAGAEKRGVRLILF